MTPCSKNIPTSTMIPVMKSQSIPAYMGMSLEIRKTPFGNLSVMEVTTEISNANSKCIKTGKWVMSFLLIPTHRDALLEALRKFLVEGSDTTLNAFGDQVPFYRSLRPGMTVNN